MAKDLGILEDSKLTMGQQCALTLERLTASQAVIGRSIAGRLREVIISFKLALVRPHLENSIQFGASLIQETWINGTKFSRGPPRWSRAEALPL